MPTPGAGPSWEDNLPPPGDSVSWSEQDWHWDPVAMTATALHKPAGHRSALAGGGAGAGTQLLHDPQQPPRHPAGCSAVGGSLEEFVCGVTHAKGSAEGGSEGPAAGSTDGEGGGSAGGGGAASTQPPARSRGGARQRKAASAAASGIACVCQADGCGADLSGHTYYHQRNKICSVHIKADTFLRDGQQLRFCQRCGNAHPLSEFDPGKHSCRKQLEKHNARRRKRQQAAAAAAAAPQEPAARQQGGQRAKRSRGKAASPQAAQAEAETGDGAAATAAAAAKVPETAHAVAVGRQQQQQQQPLERAGSLHACSHRSASGSAASTLPSGPANRADTHAQGGAQPPAASLAVAVAAAALPAAPRQPSPPLPILDFDLDSLKPFPLEEMFRSGAGSGAELASSETGADLAEELAAWLNSNLAEDAAQQQQLQAAAATMPLAQPATSAWLPQPQLYKQQPPHQLYQQQPQPASLLLAQGIMQQQVLPLNSLMFGQTQQVQQAQQQQQQQHQNLAIGSGGLLSLPQPTMQTAAQHQLLASPAPASAAATAVAVGIPVSAPLAQQLQQQPAQQQAQVQQYQLQRAPSADTGNAAPASSATQAVPAGSGAGASGAAGSGSSPPATLATVSVKLFGCTPAELPPGLRDHLKGWFDGAVQSLDGYLRPGCVHLTVQALLDGVVMAVQQQEHGGAQGATARQQQQQQQGPGASANVADAAATAAAPAALATAATAAAGTGKGQAQGACQKQSCCPDGATSAPAAAAAVPLAGIAGNGAGSAAPPGTLAGSAPQAQAAPHAAGASCCGRKRAAPVPAEPDGGTDSAVRRVVARMLQSGEALWRTKTMLVQAGSHVALVHCGRLQKTWDLEGAPLARAVPAILEVSPPLLLSSQPDTLRVSGINMLQNDCQLLMRLQGRYVQPAAARCGDCDCCHVPVHPTRGVGPAGEAAAAAAAASFEQRCCGCCKGKLQLAGLVQCMPAVPAAAATAAVGAAAAALPGGAEPPAMRAQQQADTAGMAKPVPPPRSCCAPKPEQAGAPSSSREPATPTPAGRRVAAGAARMQSLRVQLPSQAQQAAVGQPPLPPGLLYLDVSRRAYTAPRGARVLVVSSPSVHRELMQLAGGTPGALPQSLLDQLGVVHEWLGQPQKMQYQLVEATAARLLYWATLHGLPATASLLLSVLQADSGSSAAAAATVLQRALQPELVGGVAAAAAARMDGLSQLHLSMQATSAAAMQRAAELACHDGLSLLHRAVQSGSPAMLAAVLGWGEEAGSPCRCDLAGPVGLSPLHLAALLPNPAAARQAVLQLLSRCPPGANAWDCCCAADGQTPAAFYSAAAGAAAAGALGREVAALLHLQQQAAGCAPTALPAAAPQLVAHSPANAAQQPQQLKLVTRPKLPAEGLSQQQQQREQGQQQGERCVPAEATPLLPALPTELQPDTPRRNPGCLCAPGCPCALLDRCACCGASDDDEEQTGGTPHGTCGAGSGKCCCCRESGEKGLPGCAGCEGPRSPGAEAAPASGGCCGGSGGGAGVRAPAPPCRGGRG